MDGAFFLTKENTMGRKYLDLTGLNKLWAKIKSWFQTIDNLVTSWGSTPSDTKYPSEKLVKTSLDGTVQSITFNETTNTASSGNINLGAHPTAGENSATTVQALIQDLSKTVGGRIGSVSLSLASTISALTIQSGWYNFIWLPHRQGGTSGDNSKYGTLIMTPLTSIPNVYVIEGGGLNGNSPIYQARRLLRSSEAGVASGVASLDSSGKVPASQLPKIGTSGILNDAITAALVKDGETLPVNVTGGAKYVLRKAIGATAIDLNNLTFTDDDSKIEVVEWWDANKDNVANKPINSSGTLMMFGYGNVNYVQIANMSGSSSIYWRTKTSNTWSSWRSRGSANGVASLDANGKVPTSQLPISKTGDYLNPIFINSNNEFVKCDFFYWDQIRNDSHPTALIPWGCQNKVSSHTNAEASTSGYVRYISIVSNIGGLYYITGSVPYGPCHITLQLGAFSYGNTYYKILDYSGYGAVNANLTHLYMKRDSTGKSVYYIKFKSSLTNLNANAVDIKVWSSSNHATVSYLTQSEFDALGGMNLTVPLWVSGNNDNIFPQSQRIWYNTKPYAYGSGGDASTPVYVDSNGAIVPCSNVPVIEHVTSIPSNPTVGTIYAL